MYNIYINATEIQKEENMKRKLISLLSLLLCITTLIGCFTACGGGNGDNGDDKDDDDIDPEELEYIKGSDQMITIKDFTSKEIALESGDAATYKNIANATVSTSISYENSGASARWDSYAQSEGIMIPYANDVSDYAGIRIRVYSEKATNATISVCLVCHKDGANTPYKRQTFTVDFTGWKTIDIALSTMDIGYGANLENLDYIRLTTSGWSVTPISGTVLYLDSISFTEREFSMTEEEIGDFNYDSVKQKLVTMLTGGVSLDEANETDRAKLEGYVNAAKSARSQMRRNADTPFAADMETTAGITSNYGKIKSMALAYAIEGSELYHDEALLEDIVYAMDKMHSGYYRDRSLHPYPKRNNWWDWEIGSAQHIVNIILLCEEGLMEAQINRWLEPVNAYVPYPSMTMANLVDLAYVCIGASAIQKDYKRLAVSRDAINECCVYVSKGDGFYEDGSFVQHNAIAYTGSYGPIVLEGTSKLLIATSGTCFRFADEIVDFQYRWVTEAYTPVMVHGAFFSHVRGRSICRTSTDVSLGTSVLIGMLRMTSYMPKGEKLNYVKSIIKEYNLYNGTYYKTALSPDNNKLLADVIADESVQPRTNYVFSKNFGNMDRTVAHLQKYSVGLSLSSTRIAKYEAINEENRNGWYTGDGMLYIYTDVNDYEPAYWRNVNMYRIPGTTVTTAPREIKNISEKNVLTPYDFVGGTAMNGYAVTAMQFDAAAPKIGYNSTLTGKKAWFIFDNEVVCLGAGISCSDNYDTLTVIENRRLALDGAFKADGAAISGTSGKISGKQMLYVENFGGIGISPSDEVCFNRVTNNGVSFLELYFDHGKNFTNETYSYVLFPTMTESELAAYSANPEIQILVNTSSVMAVRDLSSGITSYVFWEAGTYNGVTVDKPCTVMVSASSVAVADPTHLVPDINVTVNDTNYTFTGLTVGQTQIKGR